MARTGVDHGVLLTPALKLAAANLAFPSWLTITATAAGSADHPRGELLHDPARSWHTPEVRPEPLAGQASITANPGPLLSLNALYEPQYRRRDGRDIRLGF